MIHWRIGIVTKIDKERRNVQFIQVKEENGENIKAIHYTDVHPSVQIGHEVLLNTTAVDLQLGSGGYHFVYMILNNKKYLDKGENRNRDDNSSKSSSKKIGHIMKFRYTPQQRAVLTCEEEDSSTHSLFLEDRNLEGTPVLIGELHSMLPILCTWLQYKQNQDKISNKLKIGYVMSEGGALPISFSEHVAQLKYLNWIEGTITYGHSYGGDIEAVNKFTALIAAKHILLADIIIILMGPGIVGTGTKLGHTGIEAGEIANAVSILGGVPVMVPRISFQRNRDRHKGISHHILITLSNIVLQSSRVPLPFNLPKKYKDHIQKQLTDYHLYKKHNITLNTELFINEVEKSVDLYPYPIKSMGMGLHDDPYFFLGVCCAAQDALNVVQRE
ncbi:DUF3866 family protein [Chengkuizengella sediminis]|uniref:DUF3866 family protein n=1 Tax=Chengkuizengella sediminis TaxID=1885917 RepID=UPI001389773C|nr:DUF3866 family protein [Chengkuizengella sediminis]NDI34256.1 DUF3866 family protein [Chengkuizengella sediminis]